MSELAAEMGCTRQCVFGLHGRALALLRKRRQQEWHRAQEQQKKEVKALLMKALPIGDSLIGNTSQVAAAEPLPYRSAEQVISEWIAYFEQIHPGQKPTDKWLSARTRIGMGAVNNHKRAFYERRADCERRPARLKAEQE